MEALGVNKSPLIAVHYFIFLYYSYVDQSVPQSVQNLTAFKVGFGIQFWKFYTTHVKNMNTFRQHTKGHRYPNLRHAQNSRKHNY